jgi:hypothetical protein
MVLLASTSLKDSNGMRFAIFGSTELKIWFLQDADQIWFEILNQTSVWTRAGHVAVFYWRVPIRADYDWEP